MAELRVTHEVHGLKATLQELYYLDRTLYNATRDELKATAQPLVKYVRAAFPQVVLSKMMKPPRDSKRKYGPFPTYRKNKVDQGVTAKVGGRKNRYTNEFPILRIQQRNAAAQVFDMAQVQRTQGNTFVANLKKEGYGDASRIMWPTVRAHIGEIEERLQAAIARAERVVGERLSVTTSQRQAQSDRSKAQPRNALGQFSADIP